MKSIIYGVLASLLILLLCGPLIAQTDFRTRNPVGLFEDMEADTVTAELFNHFGPTPDLAFAVHSPVPGEVLFADTRTMVALDFDNDGDQDFIMGGPAYPGEHPARLMISNGDGTFEVDTSRELPGRIYSAVAADFDNDGWTDLAVMLMTGGIRLEEWEPTEIDKLQASTEPEDFHPAFFRNEEGRRFQEMSDEYFPSRISGKGVWNIQASDFDQDGWLDLVMVMVNYEPFVHSTLIFHYGSALGFIPGGSLTMDFEHAVILTIIDINEDSSPDILVQEGSFFPAGHRNLVWWANLGQRQWEAKGAFPLTQMSRITPMYQIDVNNDGLVDLFAGQSDFQGGANQLNINRGNKVYENLGKEMGLWAGYTLTDGALWGDWNNDTYQDMVQLRSFNTSGYTESVLYLNDGGRRFLNISGLIEAKLGPGSFSGIPLDADLDGDLDIILSHNTSYIDSTPLEDTVLQMIRNDSKVGNWLEIKLEGTSSNRSAIGGRASVYCGDNSYHQLVGNGASWGIHQPPLEMHFGLGNQSAVDSVLVTWPNGQQEAWGETSGNQRVVLTEGEGGTRSGK